MASDFSREIDYLIYPVSVDFDPIIWAIYCEICELVVSEKTVEEQVLGLEELAHKAFHEGMSVQDYKVLRRKLKKLKGQGTE